MRKGPTVHTRENPAPDGERIEAPQGTLDLLMLKAISLEPLHGWAISERLYQVTGGTFRVQQGSIYPALHRLERKGWIRSSWQTTENNRVAKYYELTRTGRARLAAETSAWRKLHAAVKCVLDMA
jgi:transcriptional regulator